MKYGAVLVLIVVGLGSLSEGLDNGLARTPPMGWMHWERYSENLFKATTDMLVSVGYAAAGYEYVIIDDCWLERERDNVTKKLVEERERFPNGLNALADYINAKGMKFGLYQDYGTLTCAGYPGVINHMALDAQTFADWDVDYVKLDGCYADINVDGGVDVHSLDKGRRLCGVRLKPWMNRNILEKIKLKNKLGVKLYKHPQNISPKNRYKNMCIKLKKEILKNRRD